LTYPGKLPDSFDLNGFDQDTCPLTLTLIKKDADEAISAEDEELIEIKDEQLVLTQEKFNEGSSKAYRLKAEAPNNHPVFVDISITEKPCDVQSLEEKNKGVVKIYEATAGKDEVLEQGLEFLFNDSEQYLCKNTYYEVTDLEGDKKGLPSKMAEKIADGII
jgi:hypothetical protein